MKLYYSPGACSLASHITLNEAGVDFAAEKVDLRAKRTESGADFSAITPRGAVPALDLGNGEVLTEGVAIMQHVMDSAAPGALPAIGTVARARLAEALNYVSTEVHKTYSPFFRGLEGEAKAAQLALLDARLQVIEDRMVEMQLTLDRLAGGGSKPVLPAPPRTRKPPPSVVEVPAPPAAAAKRRRKAKS